MMGVTVKYLPPTDRSRITTGTTRPRTGSKKQPSHGPPVGKNKAHTSRLYMKKLLAPITLDLLQDAVNLAQSASRAGLRLSVHSAIGWQERFMLERKGARLFSSNSVEEVSFYVRGYTAAQSHASQ